MPLMRKAGSSALLRVGAKFAGSGACCCEDSVVACGGCTGDASRFYLLNFSGYERFAPSPGPGPCTDMLCDIFNGMHVVEYDSTFTLFGTTTCQWLGVPFVLACCSGEAAVQARLRINRIDASGQRQVDAAMTVLGSASFGTFQTALISSSTPLNCGSWEDFAITGIGGNTVGQCCAHNGSGSATATAIPPP